MSLWLDCSGSYAIVPSPEQVADLRALGFEGAIVGTSWSRPQALAQLSAFQSGGMRTQEYQFPSALRPPQGDWWIDAELPDATMITLRNAMSAGARGPYSRKGWADENQPGWNCKAEFPDAELWDARYVHGDVRCLISEAISTGRDVAAAIATERAMMPPFRPYWGFTKATITQWHNSITICGVNMDLNEYEDAPKEDGMRPYLCWDKDRQRVYLIGPFGAAWITQPADVATLEGQFGKLAVAYSATTIDAIG